MDTATDREVSADGQTSSAVSVKKIREPAAGWMVLAAAFFCGFAVMGLELLEARLMAPYFGTSILVWTNIIGVILAAMALGAWVGGRLADRYPTYSTLAMFFVFSGAWAVFLAAAGRVILAFFVALPPAWMVPLASLLLFAPPLFLLGAVSPALLRLAVKDVSRTGHVAGSLAAFGTLGSLVGTYATGYLLLPRFAVSELLSGIGIGLVAAGILLFGRRSAKAYALAGAIGLVTVPGAYAGKYLYPWVEIPSAYNYVAIRESLWEGRPSRILMVNAGYHSAAAVDEPQASVFDYVKAFHVVDEFVAEPDSMLLVGGGGMHAASEFVARHPASKVDVLEMDPAVYRAGLEAFGLSDASRINVIIDDARPAMRRLDKVYDVVLVDAFGGDHCVPWQLMTREAVAEYARLLAPDGVWAANIIMPQKPAGPKGERFVSRLLGTLRGSFNWVVMISLNKGLEPRHVSNTLVLAGSGQQPDASALAATLMAKYGVTRARPIDGIAPGAPWTDDAGPADYDSLAMYTEAEYW
jgi:MFS family permease